MTQATVSRPLVVDRLTKTYPGGVQAVRGISFEVTEGEIFGLLGPNGAGKTTALGVLTTLVRPSGGLALVAGLDGLTERASDSVRTYSGGMKRRLEIARALLGRPGILLLDEPTLGLDPIVRGELWEMIRTLQAVHGVTVLVSTHYLEEAQGVCDRVAIMDQGRIIALDTPARLIAGLGHHVLDIGTGADPAPVLAVLRPAPPGLGEPLRTGTTVSVPSSLPAPELTDLAGRLDLTSAGAQAISIRPATLNDVFLHLTSAARARMETPA